MLTESIDFFSFSYDDNEVLKPYFVSLPVFSQNFIPLSFRIFHQQIFFLRHFHKLNQHTISER